VTALEIIALLDAASQLSSLALGWINRGKVRGEWTLGEEQEFDARIAALATRPEWRIDK
jgi:hypothetical protein